jgi:hypothetical protein
MNSRDRIRFGNITQRNHPNIEIKTIVCQELNNLAIKQITIWKIEQRVDERLANSNQLKQSNATNYQRGKIPNI